MKQVELGKGKNYDLSKVVDLYDEGEMLEEIDANNLILDAEKSEGEEGEEKPKKNKKDKRPNKE